jgi:hypothetical protein
VEAPRETPTASESGEPVLSPLGHQAAEGFVLAAGPPSLVGRKIALVWDELFFGDKAFSLLRDELSGRYRDVEFIGCDVFEDIHGFDGERVIREIGWALRQHGEEGVLIGVGN